MPKLYVVATPIGNLSDISERALHVLRSVALIAAEDTRRSRPLLVHFGIKTPLVSYHKHNEQKRSAELVGKMHSEGVDIALVSDAGTPCISDPGATLVAEARLAGMEVEAIPGASALTAALSASGFCGTAFSFHGFIPRTKKGRSALYQAIKSADIITHVMFEAPGRIVASLSELAAALPEYQAFVVNDISKFHERSYTGDVAAVAREVSTNEKAGLGEYVIIVQRGEGEAASSRNLSDPSSRNLPTPSSRNLPTPSSRNVLMRDPLCVADHISLEALLVDIMLSQNCSLKEAVNILGAEKGISKNEAYKASLRLKEMFM